MIRDSFSKKISDIISDDEWLVVQERYDPEQTLVYESLFCLSNGYLGVRGAHEEGTKKSIPCNYINGVFDKSETFMRELANMPNWLGIKMYVEKAMISVEDCEIIDFIRVLDMKNALLFKRVVLRDRNDRETAVETVRMVSRANVHRMGIKVYVTPVNYSGIIEVENIIDGSVINFCDAPRFKVKHTYLKLNESLWDGDGAYVQVATRDRNLNVGVGGCIQGSHLKNRQYGAFGETAVEFKDFDAVKGETVEFTKYVGIFTEREIKESEIKGAIQTEISKFMETGFDAELTNHIKVYEKMWENADIKIEGDPEINKAIRFNVFHLMSAGNEHDSNVNVGAKLLSGEEYGGHAFWDTELFMLPFFAFVFPHTASNLENYRYHLLDAARDNARKNGYRGAQYPWESADDGTEQCPDWTIEPDGTCYRCYVAVYEHHVTAAVAYGISNYVKITGDVAYLKEKGLEILVETARFWVSRCQYNEKMDRYEIRQVTGPDEWHEPVDNNLYTNYLARWNLKYVLKLLDDMKLSDMTCYDSLCKKIRLDASEFEQWKDCIEKIYLPRKEGTRLLEQFEGYFDLDEVLITEYDQYDWPVRPKELKTKKTSETQIIKQADVVMLMHLLGNEFDDETKRVNYNYYEKRTLHGSSLSPSIYAIMGMNVGDTSKAYRYLKRAATLDLYNLQKNTREGIHAANTGGVWQTVVFGFAGVSIDNSGILCINPRIPVEWSGLKFRLHFAGSWIEINICRENKCNVRLLSGNALKVKINNEYVDITQ